MGDVYHSMGTSADGFINDRGGDFQFSAPTEELHEVFNQQMRETSALVCGTRVYEDLKIWFQWAQEDGHPPVMADFAAAFVATDVYLVSDSVTEAEHVTVVPRAEGRALVERLKRETDGLVEVSGATFAASVADLIDEFRLWVSPIAVGGGTPFWPAVTERVPLRLEECTSYDPGLVYLRYRVARA